MTTAAEKIFIVGIGDDGLEGLTEAARRLIAEADLLVGDESTLARVPSTAAKRFAVGAEIDDAIEQIRQAGSGRIVVLASGDPLFYGTARYLCDRLGKERFEVLPHVSSMQLAFARVKESWEEAYLTNLATQPLEKVVDRIRVAEKAGLFTSEAATPTVVAEALLNRGIEYFSAYVCENLGSPDERVTKAELRDLVGHDFAPLNVMILVRKPDAPDRPTQALGFRLFGNPDDAFLQSKPKRGLLTPAEVRAMALAELDLGPASIVWDVGAGSGSVAVEAAAIAQDGTTYAIEKDSEDFALIKSNAERFGRSNLVAIHGEAPEVFAGLPDPDCIFVGGTGRGVSRLAELAYERLRPGGRMVLNVASIDNIADIHSTLERLGVEADVRMINIARGTYQLERVRFEALNPTFLISAVKPG